MFDLDDVLELVLDLLGDVIEEVSIGRKKQAKPGPKQTRPKKENPKPKLTRPKKENARQPDEEPWERKEERPPWEE